MFALRARPSWRRGSVSRRGSPRSARISNRLACRRGQSVLLKWTIYQSKKNYGPPNRLHSRFTYSVLKSFDHCGTKWSTSTATARLDRVVTPQKRPKRHQGSVPKRHQESVPKRHQASVPQITVLDTPGRFFLEGGGHN